MAGLLLLPREYSGRGADIYDSDDFVPLNELIISFPDKLKFLPIALVAFIIAYLFFRKRRSIPTNKPWYGIYEKDNGWQKAGLIICWLAFIIGVFPPAWTALDIVWRTVVGGTLTIIGWLLQTLISIIVLLFFVAATPCSCYDFLEKRNKVVAWIISVLLFIGSVIVVAYFWHNIINWPFMFPPLVFNL